MNQAEVKRRQAEEVSNILALITIPILGRMMGNNGVAYVALAVEMYALLWAALSGSLSDALGRLLRNRRNKGQYANAVKIRGNAMMVRAALGLAGSLLLLIFSKVLAEDVFRIRYSVLILRTLAPAVFLRTVSAVLSGYFQGEGSEFPRAVSGILRQIFILGFGFLFGGIAKGYGEKAGKLLKEDNFIPMYGGVGIAAAVCLTEVFILLFLTVIFKCSRKTERRPESRYIGLDSLADCMRHLAAYEWPMPVIGILKVLPLISGLFFFARTAEEENIMAAEYGVYAGKYLVVCGVAVCLICVATLPAVGGIFTYFKSGENRFARRVFESGVHVCVVHGIFLAVFTAIMGQQINLLLCPEGGEVLSKMLTGGSALIPFAALSCYFGRVLKRAGKKYPLLVAGIMSNICFAASAIVLCSAGRAGILALVYGGMAGMFVLCILLGLFSYRQMRVQADWFRMLIVPLGAGGAAGLLFLFFAKAAAPYLGSLFTLVLSFAVTGAVYWILLLIFRNFREEELDFLSGGRLLSAVGQMLRIF